MNCSFLSMLYICICSVVCISLILSVSRNCIHYSMSGSENKVYERLAGNQGHLTVTVIGVDSAIASRTCSKYVPECTWNLCAPSSHLDRSLAVIVSLAITEPPGTTPCTLAKPCIGSHCLGHASTGSGSCRLIITQLARDPEGPLAMLIETDTVITPPHDSSAADTIEVETEATAAQFE